MLLKRKALAEEKAIRPVTNLLATILLREHYHVLQQISGEGKGEVDDGFMLTFLRNVHQNLLQQWEAFTLERSTKFKERS